MRINTTFDAVTYTAVVHELAENYFSVSGEYEPHIGLMKSMCTFYNYCVTESELDDSISSADSIAAVNMLSSNGDFLCAFNNATIIDSFRLDFANAYRDAKDIIETRKSGIGHITDILKNAIAGLTEKFAPVLSQENFDVLKRIADGMVDGQNLSQAIVQDYMKSGRFAEIMSMKKSASAQIE